MKTLTCALVLLGCGPAFAAGFNVDTHSGRATGMASAVVADVNGPSAVLYNPADIHRGKGVLDLELGDTLIIPGNKFTPVGGEIISGTTGPVPPPTAYGTYGITRNLSVGLGLFSPYGLKVKWPENFVGQDLITEAALTTYYSNPEVAYRFGQLKIGAGLQVVRATVELQRSINFVDSRGTIDLAGGAWGVGGNAGVLAELVPGLLSVGATYRSRVSLNFDGNAHFSDTPPPFAGSGPGQIRDQAVTTSVTIPDQVGMGLSVQPVSGLRVNFDANYYAWQVFQDLGIEFEDPALNEVEPKRWSHSWNFHLGGEYAVTSNIAVRTGVLYDLTPSPADTLSPTIPDADRINAAVGVGYHVGKFRADLAYQHVFFLANESTLPELPGTYTGGADLVGLSLGFRL
ncbi:MAG: OmpP1/FadL family transporter [Myxococcaceae bacterium]